MINNFIQLLDEVENTHSPSFSLLLEEVMYSISKNVRTSYTLEPIDPGLRLKFNQKFATIMMDTLQSTTHIMRSHFEKELKQFSTKSELEALQLNLGNNYIEAFGARKAAGILRTTEKQLQDLIRGGMAQGEAASTVFNHVESRIPELAEMRGLLITRTEAHSVSQYTSQKTAERSQIALDKIWNTSQDAHVRGQGMKVSQFKHNVMHGNRIGLYQAFHVPRTKGGFEPLLFIGDPRGSAANIINCRCIQTYARKG